jgi:predicted SAM-dependent methyltransferase
VWLVQRKLYVQYGCGWSAPQGWRNFDASPALRFERLPVIGRLYTKNGARFPQGVEFGDIVKGLPIEANACDGIYCSHVLEHLALSDFRRALENTFRLLKSGSTFRLVLPDLASSARRYLESSRPDASFAFMRETCLGEEERARSLKGFLTHWLGNSRHLWMWDYESMYGELKAAGFVNIRRATFGDSQDAMFATVEQKDRWDDCLGVECTKP